MAPFLRNIIQIALVFPGDHLLRRGIRSQTTILSHQVSSDICGDSVQALKKGPRIQNEDHIELLDESTCMDRYHKDLRKLSKFLGAGPDMLYLSTRCDGVRGAFVSEAVEKGDVILRLPVSSCLQDDEPPAWFTHNSGSADDWTMRLAAALLDLWLNISLQYPKDIANGLSLWLSLLPDPNQLRASLPVHWREEIISTSKCTALELAADSSYFARAEAVEGIVSCLLETEHFDGIVDKERLELMAHNALDIVQTRSCRVECADDVEWGPPLRVVPPILDFLNHGSSRCAGSDKKGSANASYQLERANDNMGEGELVVRATRRISSHEEVLVDYGSHTRPAYNCLNHFGFVPAHGNEEDDSTEFFVGGRKFEVGPSTIPLEMVEMMNVLASDEGDDLSEGVSELTPEVALVLADRLSEVGFQLLLDPEALGAFADDDEMISPDIVIGAELAASLRFYHHQVLLACSFALRDSFFSESAARP